ncbi:hypothetical protein SCUCBS95973_002926 [Sporothrix curviconia]|uniref:Heterokaryon incompatibility domain-containing protein n=1 Tax=Sporothrix curviconia TaxID=1260050 RepID=A0ABP0BAZ5_9PEZI
MVDIGLRLKMPSAPHSIFGFLTSFLYGKSKGEEEPQLSVEDELVPVPSPVLVPAPAPAHVPTPDLAPSAPEPNEAEAIQAAKPIDGFRHSPLLQKDSIRLLRLLPNKDANARIQCQLFEYPLGGPTDEVHLYEALSYVWGSVDNPQTIDVVSPIPGSDPPHALSVTANLHIALKHLRNRHVERLLWIDAVCIDQLNNDEKAQQIQMMAKVYNRAHRVVVWLGESSDDGDKALCEIRDAASRQHGREVVMKRINTDNDDAVPKLLERDWFQRIWILQEAAAARSVVVKCGAGEIDGYVFWSGLNALDPYQHAPDLRNLIPPIAALIAGANFRPRYESPAGRPFTLQISPIAHLIDRFHIRKATVPLDKVYALLGMRSDTAARDDLVVDYRVPWKDLFAKVVRLATSDDAAIHTWEGSEVAVINTRACVLGEVTAVAWGDGVPSDENSRTSQNRRLTSPPYQAARTPSRVPPSFTRVPSLRSPQGQGRTSSLQATDGMQNDQQVLTLQSYRGRPQHGTGNTVYHLRFHATAKTVMKNDVLLLLAGAATPTIVRPCKGYLAVIVASVPLQDGLSLESPVFNSPGHWQVDRDFKNDVNLVWDWAPSPRYEDDLDTFLSARHLLPAEHESDDDRHWQAFDRAVRFWNMGLLYLQMDKHHEAFQYEAWARAAYKAFRNSAGTAIATAAAATTATATATTAPATTTATSTSTLTAAATAFTVDDHSVRAGLSMAFEYAHEDGARLMLNQNTGGRLTDETISSFGWSSGHTPLLCAIRHGYISIVRLLISKGAHAEARGLMGETPLTCAAEHGYDSIVHLLLVGEHVDVERRDADDQRGWTALMHAAANGYMDVVQLLLDFHADINARATGGDQLTALICAAIGGHEAVAMLLLDNGARLETADGLGKTALIHAVEGNHEDLVWSLLGRSADIAARDDKGHTALVHALAGGHRDMVLLLLDNDADIATQDKEGLTPLEHAVQSGSRDMVLDLLQRGAAADAERLEGQVAQYVASTTSMSLPSPSEQHGTDLLIRCVAEQHRKVLQLLVEMGVDLDGQDNKGLTALMHAVIRGNTAAINFLVKRGAAMDAHDLDGKTALMHAVVGAQTRAAGLLLMHGANVDARDNHGRTALMHDALEDGIAYDDLLQRSADLEARDDNGWTAVMHAAVEGKWINAQGLLKRHHANIDARDNNGQTALAIATLAGKWGTAGLLLENGADINAQDKNGWTVLMHAVDRRLGPRVVYDLLDKGADYLIEAYDGQTTAVTLAATHGERMPPAGFSQRRASSAAVGRVGSGRLGREASPSVTAHNRKRIRQETTEWGPTAVFNGRFYQ